jgi:hypothetical protein
MSSASIRFSLAARFDELREPRRKKAGFAGMAVSAVGPFPRAGAQPRISRHHELHELRPVPDSENVRFS